MNNEIKRLEMRVKLGSGDEELDLVQSAALRDLMAVYESRIATLTAERDEARSELEDAQRQEIETIAAVINHRKLIDEQKQKIDFLTAELAALTSCPAMEEVDRGSCDGRRDVLHPKADVFHNSVLGKQREEIDFNGVGENNPRPNARWVLKGGDYGPVEDSGAE